MADKVQGKAHAAVVGDQTFRYPKYAMQRLIFLPDLVPRRIRLRHNATRTKSLRRSHRGVNNRETHSYPGHL